MKKINFLSLFLVLSVGFFVLIKFYFFPTLSFVLKKGFQTNFYLQKFSFDLKDGIILTNLKIKKQNSFNIKINKIKLLPGRTFSGFSKMKWILAKLSINNAKIILFTKKSKEKIKIPKYMPFFPFKQILIKNSSIKIKNQDYTIKINKINIKGNKDYILNLKSIIFESKSLPKEITGKIKINFFANKYNYQLNNIAIDSNIVKITGKTQKNIFKTDIDISTKKLSAFLNLKLKGKIKIQITSNLQNTHPKINIKTFVNNAKIPTKGINLFNLFSDLTLDSNQLKINTISLFHKNNPVASIKGSWKFKTDKIKGAIFLKNLDFNNFLNRVGQTGIVDMAVFGKIPFVFNLKTLRLDVSPHLIAKKFQIDKGEILKLSEPCFINAKAKIFPKYASISSGRIYTKDKKANIFIKNARFELDSNKTLKIEIAKNSFLDFDKLKNIVGFPVSGFGNIYGKIYSKYSSPIIKGVFNGKKILFDGFLIDSTTLNINLKKFILYFKAHNLKYHSLFSKEAELSVDLNKNIPKVKFNIKELKGNLKDIIYNISKKQIDIKAPFSLKAKGKIENGIQNIDGQLKIGKILIKNKEVANSLNTIVLTKQNHINIKTMVLKYKNTALSFKGFMNKNNFNLNITGKLFSFFKKDFKELKNINFIAPNLSLKITGTLFKPTFEGDLFLGKLSAFNTNFGNLSASVKKDENKKTYKLILDCGNYLHFNGETPDFSLKTLKATAKINKFKYKHKDFFLKTSAIIKLNKEKIKAKINDTKIKYQNFAIKNKNTIKIEGPLKNLKIKQLDFIGKGINIQAKGKITNYTPAITLKGTLNTATIISNRIKQIKNISGKIKFTSTLQGNYFKTQLSPQNLSFLFNFKQLTFPVTNLNGNIYIKNKSIKLNIYSLIGDGKLKLNGTWNYSDTEDSTLFLKIINSTVLYPPVGNFSISMNNKIILNQFNLTQLKGKIEIKNLAYRREISLENQLLSMLLSKTMTASSIEENNNSLNPELDINIIGKNDITIKNDLITTALKFNLKLEGFLDSPYLTGTINMLNGTLVFKQNNFSIKRGIINIETDDKIKPYLDIEADTNITTYEDQKDYKITLTATGFPDTLQIRLTSTPQLEENQLYSLLLFGDIQDTNTSNIAISAMTNFLGISGEVKKSFKLSRFELTPKYSELDNKTVLKLIATKEIYKNYFLTFESNPVDPADQLINLEYIKNRLTTGINWKNKNKLESKFGAIGFNIKLNYVFQ